MAPYGVYDVTANQGWVSVGINHDTAEFAVESIRHGWREMGQPLYPTASRLLITADGGGSNGYRVRRWRVRLQKLADELQMTIPVCHFPPGTSQWNKIEQRMFCHITNNGRGRPLLSRAVVVNLIGVALPPSRDCAFSRDWMRIPTQRVSRYPLRNSRSWRLSATNFRASGTTDLDLANAPPHCELFKLFFLGS